MKQSVPKLELQIVEKNMATIERPLQGDDILIGSNFADELFGRKGDDILIGVDGNDHLAGGSGKDLLYGGDGDDALHGGRGKDKLLGGDGADTFVFTGRSGKDAILDFDLDSDILQIEATDKITSVDDVVARASENKKGDVVINLGGGDKIVLKGVTLDEFKDDAEGHIVVL